MSTETGEVVSRQFADALTLIAAERRRQVEAEGYSPKHDDEHDDEALARAAACYALPERTREILRFVERAPDFMPPFGWPWAYAHWKPTPDDRVRELVKAGALIVAEIERLQRLSDLKEDHQ